MSKTTTILFLAANPKDTSRLGLAEEVRTIQEVLRASQYRDSFNIQQEWAVRVSDLQAHLLRHKPHIVHFSGHGSSSSEIVLEDTNGKSQPVPSRALGDLFSILKDDIRCVVLNACYSEQQARAIADQIDCVIGMSQAIGDTAAISFSKAFYQAIGFGRDVKTAFELGRVQIDMENLSEKDTPKLLVNRCDPQTIVFTSGVSIPKFRESDTWPNRFRLFIEEKTKGFVGRQYVFDSFNEFLNNEQNGYFIIQGDPGEGKSAILAEYVRRTSCVAHFNIRAEGITSPTQFLDSIFAQLSSRYSISKTSTEDIT